MLCLVICNMGARNFQKLMNFIYVVILIRITIYFGFIFFGFINGDQHIIRVP